MIFRGAPTHILPLAELNISPMTTLVDVQTPKTPIAPWGVRSSLWGMMLVVAGSASGAFFGDTVLGAALGLVASSAVTSYLNHNEKIAHAFGSSWPWFQPYGCSPRASLHKNEAAEPISPPTPPEGG